MHWRPCFILEALRIFLIQLIQLLEQQLVLLRWLAIVFSNFQHLYFDGSNYQS